MTTVGDQLYHLGGVPVGGKFTTGNVFFLDSGVGSNANEGTAVDSPLATLAYAISKCTANNGDIIYVMPGHAETTTAIPVNVAGIEILGLGTGISQPTITATTGASDLLDVSVKSVHIDNIALMGAASGVTALIDLAAGSDNLHLSNCLLSSGATPLKQITAPEGTHFVKIEHCVFRGTAAGIANSLFLGDGDVGTGFVDWIIRDCTFNYTESVGCDSGAILCSTSSGGITGILIQDCNFLGLANGEAAVNPQGVTTGKATGLMVRCNYQGADGTDAWVQSDLLGYVDCFAVEAGARGAGAKLGSGTSPLLTTAFA